MRSPVRQHASAQLGNRVMKNLYRGRCVVCTNVVQKHTGSLKKNSGKWVLYCPICAPSEYWDGVKFPAPSHKFAPKLTPECTRLYLCKNGTIWITNPTHATLLDFLCSNDIFPSVSQYSCETLDLGIVIMRPLYPNPQHVNFFPKINGLSESSPQNQTEIIELIMKTFTENISCYRKFDNALRDMCKFSSRDKQLPGKLTWLVTPKCP